MESLKEKVPTIVEEIVRKTNLSFMPQIMGFPLPPKFKMI